ncbi:MAG: bifunctional phosphopantothenoylcysteine decarboxylase/phosphopantothenate--cysteine ligase CoaBC [Cyclobacteriaceae bacterium]|nr:bifunctional phosphopantothenoylcysteine decarboxylase/phosphopantothenate--cysteine ligase CoaBC [Cyclobacteriaceae bacterium]MDH5250426.1 bifunctional phosphopantothenoylcysteine decarboxylase/phosphopantothenate--cysteine ligase CoaBC [Cyclobacteriaceae bacterium]
MLRGKRIILGVCGGIAAYKSAALTRLLVKSGAEVKVIMTPSAHDFITPVTLATLSKNPVLTTFSNADNGSWNNHVELGLWADALLIAPATANSIAKMAQGICDNLLLAVYLSARCPVCVAPAMDLDMLQHPATLTNLEKVKRYGNLIIDPAHGELASGLIGIGRMAEPEDIIQHLGHLFTTAQKLAGKNVLVTAGPTYEAIDPVRFIGNHSSGKMGFAIAEELANQGATVQLVSGPTNEHTNHPRITINHVTSAEEMYNVSTTLFSTTDIAVLAAAVSDYKPTTKATQKIKKKDSDLTLSLTKTNDIAASLGKLKHKGQIVVGFALETEDERANAIKKLESKNLDLIVLNSLNDTGAGFGYDTNKITIIDRQHREKSFSLKDKRAVARDIVQAISEFQ